MKRFLVSLVLFFLFLYALLWVESSYTYSPEFGLSFDPRYAQSLDLNWRETYTDMLDDLKPTSLRIAAPWDIVEKERDTFTFDDIDFQINEAARREVKLILVVGQKTPRWPECHLPEWTNNLSKEERQNELLHYVKQVVNRYKDSPAVEIWQVENEPFIKFAFGKCDQFDPDAIKKEVAVVRVLDPSRKILVTDSGELSTWYKAVTAGDIFGSTLYRSVRDPKDKAWGYDWVPAAFYKVRARIMGADYNSFFVAELQAEPWFGTKNPHIATQPENDETLSVLRMQENIDYARKIGASRVYFWGVEWWYFMKEKRGDSRYLEVAKKALLR